MRQAGRQASAAAGAWPADNNPTYLTDPLKSHSLVHEIACARALDDAPEELDAHEHRDALVGLQHRASGDLDHVAQDRATL